MSKQDRTYARTASDLERKYKFGESFAQVMGLAEEAQNAADKAQSAADRANKAIAELDTFTEQVTQDIASLQEQIDGNITTWFKDYLPTVSNKPASDWTTTDLKNQHLGDLFYIVDNEEYNGRVYRWLLNNDTYSWVLLADSEVTKALEQAAKAQDTADGKRRVFVVQPVPPYDGGDLWTDGADLRVCRIARSTGSYTASDWELATDYINSAMASDIAQGKLDNFAQQVTRDIASLQDQIDGNITTWFKDYVPTVDNEPASEWTTEELKSQHLGDLFYVIDNEEYNGYVYRWVLTNDSYTWILVEDSEVAKAIELAAKAQDTADGKRRVFVAQPTPPYDVGDLWTDGADLKVCQTGKLTGNYSDSDWMLATDYIDRDTASDIAQGKLDEQTQDDIFNKLTNNGKAQGLYRDENGDIYINASYLATGVLRSKNGTSFYLDLDKGILKGQFTEFSISGKTVDEIASDAEKNAKDYADGVSGAAEKNAKDYADSTSSNAEQNAKNYADSASGSAEQNAKDYADGAANTAEQNAKDYANGVSGSAEQNAKDYADGVASGAEQNAKDYADGAANSAEQNAKDYADSAANTAEQNAKEAAEAYAQNAVKSQTQTDIFNKLTNNGEIEGLFMKDGQLYINASYLATGVIKSQNGKLVIDLSGESTPSFNTGISTNGLTVRSDEAGSGGYVRIYPLKMTAGDGSVFYYPNFYMLRMDDSTLFRLWSDKNDVSYLSMPSPDLKRQFSIKVGDSIDSGIWLYNDDGNDGSLVIDKDSKTHLTVDKINGRNVSFCDLIWENPDPDIEFPAQTISLEKSLANYTHFAISVIWAHGIGEQEIKIFSKNINDFCTIGFASVTRGILSREITLLTDNFITFSNGFASASNGVNNHACIPVKIYGMNWGL